MGLEELGRRVVNWGLCPMGRTTTTGRIVSTTPKAAPTAAGIALLMQQAQAKLNQSLVPVFTPPWRGLIFDDYINARRWPEYDSHDDNYAFGAALLALKHPRAKEYHALTQRSKSRMRRAYEAKMNSTHPHMAKHKELAKMFAVMQVTAKLEQP